eukprot:TRINITY_DN13351_c0_g2_i1.p1 TRINITY_DN13351_c0_g2~~TRINITY_DN13351_c0_g2_i1.p1  ORF type:complete len:860 (+),score=224.42 TRINITY_DN13351_c0_g2_i1:220-2799(+)
MYRQETQTVGVVDVGRAFWRGDVTLRDLTDGVRSTRSHRSQGDLSERLATVAGTFLARPPGEAGKTTLFGSSGKKRRKGIQPPEGAATDKLDECAEKIFVGMMEHPVCLESCMEQPACQRACHPAEYATRQAREADNEDGHMGGCTSFGLPSLADSGYSILRDNEVNWPDRLVNERLHLSMAIHCKTSMKRLCLRVDKMGLPQSVGPEQIKKLMRTLKKCDHVNVLHCCEFYEDEEGLYFMYEDFPCITLQTVTDMGIQMTQEEMVNTARECIAGTAFASSMGLLHMGWTLCHVLMPATIVHGDMSTAKVFGFGLMGVVQLDSNDHTCWAPEALEKLHQIGEGGNFITKLETAQKPGCDSWSLGCIIYTIAAKVPPFATEMDTQRKSWQFSIVFDEIDPEAKSLVESFLYPVGEKRLRAEKALHHEWIRRRWRPPHGGAHLLKKVEHFCSAPLAKRLFGRFLTRHLEAEHFRRIAKSFAALDISGSGMVTLKELQFQARLAGRPQAAASHIFGWLEAAAGGHISLSSFAECLAEHVADGPALRMAFESLDEDGSEEVSPQELWEVLQNLDDAIQVEDVKEYIASVEHLLRGLKGEEEEKKEEEKAEGKGEDDGVLSYNEFVNLFPERTQRIDAIERRVHSGREACGAAVTKFRGVANQITNWMRSMEQDKKALEKLCGATATRTAESSTAALQMKKHFQKLKELLNHLPGPHREEESEEGGRRSSRKSVVLDKKAHQHQEDEWGWETFIEKQAAVLKWKDMLTNEAKQLKQALSGRAHLSDGVDTIMANDAGSNAVEKVGDLLQWCRMQMSEYEAFTEANDSLEMLMPSVAFSSRGLRIRVDQDAANGNANQDMFGEAH